MGGRSKEFPLLFQNSIPAITSCFLREKKPTLATHDCFLEFCGSNDPEATSRYRKNVRKIRRRFCCRVLLWAEADLCNRSFSRMVRGSFSSETPFARSRYRRSE